MVAIPFFLIVPKSNGQTLLRTTGTQSFPGSGMPGCPVYQGAPEHPVAEVRALRSRGNRRKTSQVAYPMVFDGGAPFLIYEKKAGLLQAALKKA